MIQELLGGAGLIGERKISVPGALQSSPSPSPSPSPSSSTTTNTLITSSTSENQNLRCPRCDSSNTKFCYYNNYNLTQPRHFCKTCRRYWTKGGALRNVPIGGGCRKNRNTCITTPVGKSNSGKLKTMSSSEFGKSGGLIDGGFDQELPGNPILWAPQPQSSHLLSLLRTTQNPNPNFMTNVVNVKEEGVNVMIGSHMASEPTMLGSGSMLNARTLGYDSMSQVPSIGLCNSSFWRNNQNQAQQHEQNQQQSGFILGEVQNTGFQELYQRLKSTTAGYFLDQTPVLLGSVASASSSTSTILESAPVSGGELGYWNSTVSWSDLPTTNGAYR